MIRFTWSAAIRSTSPISGWNEPCARSASETVASTPWKEPRGTGPAASSACQSVSGLSAGIFVEPDEVADGASVGDDGVLATVIGGAAGFIAAIGLGVAFYRGALRLDLKRFFTVTGVLVIAFAAWLLSGAVHEIGEVAGNEFLEEIGPVVGAIYGIVLAAIYLSGINSPPAPAPTVKPPEPAQAGSEA